MTFISPLTGTAESVWADWVAPREWPGLDPEMLLDQPVVILAAHPDDEVLGVGGLLSRLAAAGADIRLVWATDGEASHPDSSEEFRADLPAVRREESAAAADVLGLAAAARTHLALPDGGLAAHQAELATRLAELTPPGATLLAPWSGDAHPDHEACGRAARQVAETTGCGVLEFPIWMWSWARPDDPRVPWTAALRVSLDPPTRARKAEAIDCFHSQVEPVGPEPTDLAVLPPGVLAYFGRGHEVLLDTAVLL